MSFGSVLVIGGCGFLGHHIVRDLLRRDQEGTTVAVLDTITTRNRQPEAIYYQADITEYDDLKEVFEKVKPRVVFHTVSPSPFEIRRTVLEEVNITGTQNILACAKAVSTVRAFIYTSSSSVVHNQRFPVVEATENLPVLHYPEQPEYYSHTKAIAEELVLAANRSNGEMLTVSIRPATLYGEGDGIITTNLSKRALSGQVKYYFGDGKNLFDVAYVKNCTSAQFLAAEALLATTGPRSNESKVEGEAFFVTDGKHVPFWGLQRLAADISGRPVAEDQTKSIPRWFIMAVATVSSWLYWIFTVGQKQPTITPYVVRITTMERTVCIDKIKARLGYEPKYTTVEGMKTGVGWYVDSHIKTNLAAKKGR